jgi:predicted RNase H-like nuclease (RuvC/YqgF family)
MEIIIKRATRFSDGHFRGGISGTAGYQKLMEKLDDELDKIDDELDKIKFINVVLERNNSEYEIHKLECNNPINCDENEAYENIAYDLTQELKSIGVQISGDAFTMEEKNKAESNIEQILNDLKNGQEVIYEDLMKEISELRELFFLGKKTWFQLLLGKGVEMVASGIVSETISKQIIENVGNSFTRLIEQ